MNVGLIKLKTLTINSKISKGGIKIFLKYVKSLLSKYGLLKNTIGSSLTLNPRT